MSRSNRSTPLRPLSAGEYPSICETEAVATQSTRRTGSTRSPSGAPSPGAPSTAKSAKPPSRLALRLQGEGRKTVVEFRKHLGWYTRGLHGASELRQRLFQIESIAEVEAIFLQYLEPVAQVA